MFLNLIVSLLVIASSAALQSNEEGLLLVESIEEGRAQPNNRISQSLQADGGCLICSRFGTSLVSEATPYLAFGNDITCGDIQDDIVGLSSDSNNCSGHLDFFDYRCCEQPSLLQSYECDTNVRSSILNDSYDKTVAPIHGVNGTLKALEVETYIVFFASKEIDVQKSTLEIFLSISLSWDDPRLRWDDSNNTTCATHVNVRADHSVEESEIWVPTIDLVNRADSDFPPHKALVTPDGRVTWSRVGSLTAICSYIGLKKIPFDDLGCRLIFSDYDGIPIDYILRETGNNLTKGFDHWDILDLHYSEFMIVDEKSRTKYGHRPGTFEVDLFFHRARRHYILFTIIPNILFTYISFGQFTFDGSEGGDRLSFSITIVLIIVTQSILTASLLPVCNELLWLNAFNVTSMLFTLAGILETLIIFLIHRLVVKKQEKEEVEGSEVVEELASLIPESAGSDADQEEIMESSISVTGDEKRDSPRHQCTSLTAVSGKDESTGEQLLPSSTRGQDENSQKGGFILAWLRIGMTKAFTTKLSSIEDLMQRVDLFCFMTFPLAYTVFLIVMLTNNKRWDDDPEDMWKPL